MASSSSSDSSSSSGPSLFDEMIAGMDRTPARRRLMWVVSEREMDHCNVPEPFFYGCLNYNMLRTLGENPSIVLSRYRKWNIVDEEILMLEHLKRDRSRPYMVSVRVHLMEDEGLPRVWYYALTKSEARQLLTEMVGPAPLTEAVAREGLSN